MTYISKSMEDVITAYKKLKLSDKKYVVGIMQGILIERERTNRTSRHLQGSARQSTTPANSGT